MNTKAQRGRVSDAVVSDVAAFLDQVNPNRARPVKLQINTNGYWRDVISFDAANEDQCAEVMGAADRLGCIGNCKFRVLIKETSTPLMNFAPGTGWKEATT